MSNQLDNFFKNKLQDRTFDYDESAWDDARALIELDEKKRKRRKWLILLSSIALISIISATAFYLGRNSALPVEEEQIEGPVAHNNANKSLNPEADLATKYISEIELDQKASGNITEAVFSSSDEKTPIESKATPYSRNKNQINKNQIAKGLQNNISTKESTNALGATSTLELSDRPVTAVYNPHEGSVVSPKHFDSANEVLVQKESSFSRLSLLNNELLLLDFEIDNNLTSQLPKISDIPESPSSLTKTTKLFFGLRAGASIAPSAFLDFDGGVFVQYNLNRNLAISFQPHYTVQQLSQQMVGESIVNEFGFGLRTSAFSLVAESIRSYHAPFLFSYAFGNKNLDLSGATNKRFLKHKISTGISYVYLDGITGAIDQKGTEGPSQIETGWLNENAFNRHNAELLLGYEYYFTKRLSLGAMARYRLRNQFSDLFVQQNSTVTQPSPYYIGLQALYRLN